MLNGPVLCAKALGSARQEKGCGIGDWDDIESNLGICDLPVFCVVRDIEFYSGEASEANECGDCEQRPSPIGEG